ncbi:hypothetical protein CIK05_06905 [Bdellovibrio sp. qaytius]|nr:hypothetical protein CIK05_06905 [Bdellovibrio sp. qaytius]
MLMRFILILILSLPAWANNTKSVFSLKDQVEKYKKLYPLDDVYKKQTDNKGDGDDTLYGTRNFRAVLNGVYYRGGANNKFNKHKKRDNQNPLPQEGLENLCKQGFSEAMYFYKDNYDESEKIITCGEEQKLEYLNLASLKAGNEKALLLQVHKHIKGEIPGPMYGHCWNGWHASGYAAVINLMQYCNWDNDKALAYWRKNTDGNDTKEYQHVMDKVKNFKKFNDEDLAITEAEAKLICP